MNIEEVLRERSGSVWELCGSTGRCFNYLDVKVELHCQAGTAVGVSPLWRKILTQLKVALTVSKL